MPNLQPLLHAWENLFSEIMRLFQEGGQLHVATFHEGPTYFQIIVPKANP